MTLKRRILLGYLVPVLLLVGVSGIVYFNVQTVRSVSTAKSLSAGSREMAAGTVQTKAGVEKLNSVALELRAMI